jgi:hypothetical protein
MSICANTVQANQQSFFFALSGGGGGGAGSTLQSPASIVPDAAVGNALLSVVALAGSNGSGQVSVIGEGTGGGAVVIGAGTQLPFRIQAEVVGALPGNNVIAITGNTEPVAAFSYNEDAHVVALGDANAAGSVKTNNAFYVSDPAGGANNVIIAPTSATESTISQSVATGGILALSSSISSPSNILTFDSAGVATTVIGGNTGAGILLRGGVGSGSPNIFANVGDAGTLSLGSSSAVTASIVMSDSGGVDPGRTVINNFVPPATSDSQILLTTIPTGVTPLTNPNPLLTGLYLFAITPNDNDVRAGINTMAYYSTASGSWRTGGATFGIPLGTGNMSFLPSADKTTMSVSNTTGGALNGASVCYCRLFTGQIGGW